MCVPDLRTTNKQQEHYICSPFLTSQQLQVHIANTEVEEVISLLFKKLRAPNDVIPPGPLTRQPCLSSIKRLQLMAKIRNNHRLPLIILN